VMLAIAGLSTSLAIAGSLAFLSTWELAFTDESSLFGTPLPTDDPDNYFFLAALSLLTALGSLFLGAAWPGRQRPLPRAAPGRAAPGRAAPGRASSRSGNAARRQAPVRRQGGAGTSQQRTSSAGRAQVRQPTSSARQVTPTQSAARQSPPRQSAAGQSPRRPAPKK
jgi:hypothetical protein